MLYVSHLFQSGHAGSTIQAKLSALAYFHKLHGYQDPCSHFLVGKAVLGAKKLSPTFHSRSPLTFNMLNNIMVAIPRLRWPHYWSTTFAAMLALSFHSFLRPGEITSSPHNLMFANVSVSDSSLFLTFHQFKHHIGEPVTIQTRAYGGATCPVSRLQAYLKLRGNQPGPLFCDMSGNPVSYSQYANFFASFKALLQLPTSISPHSARIGAATHAAANGVSECLIKQLGRWKSDAYTRYIRIPVLDTSVLGKI